jgi:nucleotide-binding universal stress UspA family protein
MTPRFHRLLVALDGSANAELALAAAVTAAQRDHATLTLVTVAPDAVAETARWAAFTGCCPAQLQREADEAAGRILRDGVARVPEDMPVTTVLRHGRPGPQIVAFARERDFDAILIGARASAGWAHWWAASRVTSCTTPTWRCSSPTPPGGAREPEPAGATR